MTLPAGVYFPAAAPSMSRAVFPIGFARAFDQKFGGVPDQHRKLRHPVFGIGGKFDDDVAHELAMVGDLFQRRIGDVAKFAFVFLETPPIHPNFRHRRGGQGRRPEGEKEGPSVDHCNNSATWAPMAREAVRPGDSMP